jgi:hypothetical protein
MQNKNVIIICGVTASGKTWICEQLTNKFQYVPHDDHIKGNIVKAIERMDNEKPIITECPFGETKLTEALKNRGFITHPYFIIEPLNTLDIRYFNRTGKPLPKNQATRSKYLIDRALEWDCPHGSSEEILTMLQTLEI